MWHALYSLCTYIKFLNPTWLALFKMWEPCTWSIFVVALVPVLCLCFSGYVSFCPVLSWKLLPIYDMAEECLEYCCEGVHNILIILNLFGMIIIYVQHLSSIADIRFSNGTVAGGEGSTVALRRELEILIHHKACESCNCGWQVSWKS